MKVNLCWDQQFSYLRLKGSGARSFLHGQTTANVLEKKDGEIFLTLWLSTTGKVRALIETRLDSEGASLIVLGGDQSLLKKAFESVIFPSDNVKLFQMEGLRRIQIINSLEKDFLGKKTWLGTDDLIIAPFNIFSKANEIEIEVWRLKIGLPIGCREINGENNPFELGLSHLINFDKGCYLGQEAIARLSRQGAIRRKLICWRSSFNIAEGDKIQRVDNKEDILRKVGIITSSSNYTREEGTLGLGFVSINSLNEDNYCIDLNQKSISINSISLELAKFI